MQLYTYIIYTLCFTNLYYNTLYIYIYKLFKSIPAATTPLVKLLMFFLQICPIFLQKPPGVPHCFTIGPQGIRIAPGHQQLGQQGGIACGVMAVLPEFSHCEGWIFQQWLRWWFWGDCFEVEANIAKIAWFEAWDYVDVFVMLKNERIQTLDGHLLEGEDACKPGINKHLRLQFLYLIPLL